MSDKINIDFCQNIVDHLNDGGIWVWPASGDTYQMDRKKKRLVFVCGSDEGFRRTKLWFGKVGWKVEK